jgi:hypothetical protein
MTTGHIFDPCSGCHLAWIKDDTDVFSGTTGKQFARLRGGTVLVAGRTPQLVPSGAAEHHQRFKPRG